MKREQILERSRREGLDEREQQIYLDAYNFSGSVCVGLCLLLTVGSILRSESFYPYSILVFAAIASSFLYRFVRLRKVSFFGMGACGSGAGVGQRRAVPDRMGGSMEELILQNRLRHARSQRHLSQGELAQLVGVSRQTICSIENHQFCPSARLALLLCIALEQPFETLFYFEDPEQPEA